MAWWIFQNLVVITVLTGAVTILCRVVRIGPVGRHALWVIVLLKFVTPPVITWPWAVPDPFGVAALDARGSPPARIEPAATTFDAEAYATDDRGLAADVAGVMAYADAARPDRTVAASTSPSIPIWPWVAGVWAAGSLVLIGIEGVRLRQLHRRMRAARPADPALIHRIAGLSARLGVAPPRVQEIDGLSAPLVWCLGRLTLLWPAGLAAAASDACLDGLLVHELAHVKRRDHFVGWIELAAGIVWWWNPLYWYVRSARREQAELACDAWVIDALPHGRRAYAESLLTLAIGPPAPSPATLLAVRAGTRRALERRLVMIMKGRAAVRLPGVGLLALLLLVAATFPAWASASGQAAAAQTPPGATSPPVSVIVKPAGQPSRDAVVPVRVAPQVRVQLQPKPAKPPAPQKKVVTLAVTPVPNKYRLTYKLAGMSELPADGQDLVKGFESDRAAIMAEADKKIDARRDDLAKALGDLQDRYTKAGKLDEAVAIRDYIRAGLPGLDSRRISITKTKNR